MDKIEAGMRMRCRFCQNSLLARDGRFICLFEINERSVQYTHLRNRDLKVVITN
jgi:pyruvate-formate lyase-activating enzyme